MKTNTIISALIALSLCMACDDGDTTKQDKPLPTQDIYVLYENDVHCAVDGYAKFAALRNEKRSVSPYVTTVSSGDFIQGSTIGAFTQGKSIINIMNAVGYDYVLPGNHEFDYGVPNLLECTKSLSATTVCCNFCTTASPEPIFTPYAIKEYGKVKVAYIGISTPATISTSTPTFFTDDKGNYIYDFHGQDLAQYVQRYVNKARSEGAHYVVALTHLGLDEADVYTSPKFVAATTGIDVLLDAHSHSVLPDTVMYNKEGKPVLVTSTGTKFQYMGVLTLDKQGTFHSQLVSTERYTPIDETVRQVVDQENKQVEDLKKRVIGQTPFDIITLGENGERLSRREETTMGDLLTDIIRQQAQADVAILNGGGLRTNIKAGEFTYADIYEVSPFGNTLVTATLTGQQLLDALEVGMCKLPEYNGSFTQVSGMKFTVNPSVVASIQWDNNGFFTGIAEGSPRRVSDLQILDRTTGQYRPVAPDRTYTIAANNYLLLNKGGEAMLAECTDVRDTGTTLVDIMCSHITKQFKGTIPDNYAKPDGRINILK
ncbi:MAG: 5'-nucleotidase C-terminal domain-containing protein [Bacteroidaceae bacterium]|nr:5'-nucleotidase C-terminal domain-containing protein [Bacteroidaceae bacterium]